ncbi:MAG: DUF4386 domain-containing protein [Caulobacteraceae bacterium]
MTSPQTWARVAGLLYLFVIGASVFALVATSNLIARDDAAATAANILANEQMFRLAFVANLLACVAYVAVVAILYEVLKPAGRTLSFVAAFVGLAGCSVSGATMLNQLGALTFLGDASYFAAFQQDQLQALARVSLRTGGLGNTIALVFFGFYCLLLSSLVFRAAFLPRLLGVLLAIAGLGWLSGSIASLLALDLPLFNYVIPISGLGEGLFTLWLLIMGVNVEKWRAQAGAT